MLEAYDTLPKATQGGESQFMMKTLAQRLRFSREKAKLSQSELARRVGIKPQAIQFIESGKVYKPRNILEIAAVVGVDAMWLSSGQGDMHNPVSIARGPKIQGHVPLITWALVAQWKSDTLRANVLQDRHQILIPTTAKIGAAAFALEVLGDSMEPEFAPQDIIVVDPDRQPHHRSFVIARKGNDKDSTLRELVIEGSRRLLKPLNPRYPIDELALIVDEVCGVVVYKSKAYFSEVNERNSAHNIVP